MGTNLSIFPEYCLINRKILKLQSRNCNFHYFFSVKGLEITKICIVLRLHFLSELTLNTFIMDKKRVYTFGNGQAEGKADMRNLLGGKGANLAEMNLIGVPVQIGRAHV